MIFRRACAGLLLLAVGCSAPTVTAASPRLPSAAPTIRVSWPADGQASLALDGRTLHSPHQVPEPIASVAKVMTAYLTVHHLPSTAHVVVDRSDVADVARRRGRGESVVPVAEGQVLTRDQALAALLLPSANNVAAMLAERVSGSWSRFVRLMNDTADQLGMTDTTYTDPSGYQPSTVSTARDQLVLLQAAMRSPTLATIMGKRTARLPVAGRIQSTNTLLQRDGFVAGKTGSTSAAGGCLAFRVIRNGRVLDGVVLGQRGGPLIDAALREASALARTTLPPT